METNAPPHPWQTLSALIQAGDAAGVRDLLATLDPHGSARVMSRLGDDDQTRLLALLSAEAAAALLTEIPDAQAAGLIEQLPARAAAAILNQIPSNQQADLLGEVRTPEAHAILERMAPEEASDARRLLEYATDTAGGVMITEYLAYPGDWTITQVLHDMEAKREAYADYSVQYLYVVDDAGRLEGVLPLRDIIFSRRDATIASVMISDPDALNARASLDEMHRYFERSLLLAVPVVDDSGRLVGVLRRAAAEEAARHRATRQFLKFSGIVRGEEFRSMPFYVRSARRLSWLSINIVLNVIAASVIAVYTDTLAAAIALAVFLPMISDMSGCSGNQAVAVSMRELTLGLVRPGDVARVVAKEACVGIINGVLLGAMLGGIAVLWKGNPWLGLVVGLALAANTLLSVCLGGVLPLVLRRLKLDPALVSGPVLTTVTDMCGFFIVLSVATALLPRLG
jgi:magnesium transporter